ncbi:MAG: hypothetical protein JRE14_17600 [Deltaproteobacteria bacterium]|nr:hypothetical protein [Deltaproteobacteria bacterium]
MSAYIATNFTPNEKTIKVLREDGIFIEFLDQCVTKHFLEYWTELKEDKKKKGQKSAWQTCYRLWARRAFHGRVGREWEENRHRRNRFGKSKPNIFQEVQAGMMGSTKRVRTVNETPPPVEPPLVPPGKPMSRKKALGELSKLSKKLGAGE